MDSELDLLLGTAIDTLVKLEILLYVHQRSSAVQNADQFAAGLRRPSAEVAPALEQLSRVQLIDRFPLGTGRHVLYGATEDTHVREVLNLLYERYYGTADSRAQLMRRIVGLAPQECPDKTSDLS